MVVSDGQLCTQKSVIRKMIRKTTIIPSMSKLKNDEKSFRYIDSYMGHYLTNSHDYTISDIGELFFTSGPKWADYLMSTRDKIVGLFGLKIVPKISEEEQNHGAFMFEEGEQLNIFKLYNKSESELIMGDIDKHLNFRVSLLLDSTDVDSKKKKILITTVVHIEIGWGSFISFLSNRFIPSS